MFRRADPFDYQNSVWTRADVTGYDELIDMSGVTEVDLSSPDRMRQLAEMSSTSDSPSGGERMAVVAPTDLTFGLARMYEAHRALQRRSTKSIGVFRTLAEALAVLEVKGDAGVRL